MFGNDLDPIGFDGVVKLRAAGKQNEKSEQPTQKQQTTVPSSNLKVAICTSIKKEKPEDMQEWIQYYKCAAVLLGPSCVAQAIPKSTKGYNEHLFESCDMV